MSQYAGRYRLGEVLGVGSFATVYRALDERLQDTVVVKVLAENHSLNPEVRERFIGEGRSLRKVSSAHVLAVHDLGESERQQPYLVLEYADRGTLQQRVERLWRSGWRATPADALALGQQLAAAISAVHSAGLVHRDLSPGNVLLQSVAAHEDQVGAVEWARGEGSDAGLGGLGRLLGADEQLVVADLGMCKDLALNSGLTVAGGTAGFRPPEQRSGPAMVDARADLWAMSQLLNWLTEGAQLPAAFRAALHRGLADDPEQRPPDAVAWLAEIETALAQAGQAAQTNAPGEDHAAATAETVSVRQSQATRLRSARRPRRALALLVVAVTVLGLAVFGGVLLGQRWAEPPAGSGGTQIAIDGPGQVGVGESATLSATVEGARSWVWVLPDGSHVADQAEITLTARTTGTAAVRLRAQDPGGTPLQVVHQIEVTDRGTRAEGPA